jgi:hypothetical protein
MGGSLGASGDLSTGIPSWVPAEGFYANIGTGSLATLASVAPPGWPTGDNAGPFSNYSGAAYSPDFGALGGYVHHGSGHVLNGVLWAGVSVWDIAARQWALRCVPPAPLIDDGQYNAFGESTQAGTVGYAYPQHVYDGLLVQPASLGGGASGTLWRVQAAGQLYSHAFDLSSPTGLQRRVFNTMPGGTGYPMVALDAGRGGFWSMNGNGNNGVNFIDFATETITAKGGGYNTYGDNSLVYLPAPYDCLIGFGRASADGVSRRYFVAPNLGGTIAFTEITSNVTGSPPADSRAGGSWCEPLSCILSYEAVGSTQVHKLTPPAPANILTGTWTWTAETLTGVGGVVPSQCRVTANGSFGRMIYIDRIKCALWLDSILDQVQAFRLTGMV